MRHRDMMFQPTYRSVPCYVPGAANRNMRPMDARSGRISCRKHPDPAAVSTCYAPAPHLLRALGVVGTARNPRTVYQPVRLSG